MPPIPERSPSVLPSQPSGRRLFSRISSPFGPKSRHVTTFEIHVNDPHRQYTPGETVAGHVNLTVAKPVRVTHLVVCLHGFVQVYKTPGNPPADGHRANAAYIGTGRGSRSGEYFGNGFASLFEDESVLCGDGRLAEGTYQFEFLMDFPDRDLPSSISFERGTISYMITATLTRPTTISPVLQCDHKVYFVERIDVSLLLPPKARTITLEPLTRKAARGKAPATRRVAETDRKSRTTETSQPSDDRRSSHTSSSASSHAPGGDTTPNPVFSDVSSDSVLSFPERRSQHDSNQTSSRLSECGRADDGKAPVSNRTISATVESLAGGCLRGDVLAVKVIVNHTRHVKSLHGAIITLYRHARVDMHPSIPLGPTEKGKESKYEDYYPKSITGLGGLSLSGAGSNHMFRKDLSQTIVPLIVDPTTLTAEIIGKVHVPDEAFPTISTVPGSMISFRYYLEVVLDIQGKLASQDRNIGNFGGLGSTMSSDMDDFDISRSAFNGSSMPVIDTATLKRDKGVVSCTFEVVIGTNDSARKRGKRRAAGTEFEPALDTQRQQQRQHLQPQIHPSPRFDQDWDGSNRGYHTPYYDHSAYADRNYDDQAYAAHAYADQAYTDAAYPGDDGYLERHAYASHQAHYEQPPPIPIPPLVDESQLPEKERLRRAEARLLPSQPPGLHEDPSEGSLAPTAPFLPDEPGLVEAASVPDLQLFAPSSHAGPSTEPMASSSMYVNSSMPFTQAAETRGQVTRSSSRTTDRDILDLEAISAEKTPTASPPTQRDADNTSEHPGSSQPAHAPCTVTLARDDELYTSDMNDSHADAGPSSELPRYER